jgi:hypothetical protein
MKMQDRREEDRQALEHLLEVYGADRTRWPARERLRIAGFISEDGEARTMLAEAAALDRLLDLAPGAGKEREHALKERIVAAALRTSDKKLVAVPTGPAASTGRRPGWSMRPALARTASTNSLPAAGLLAASLVLGVLLGSAGTFESAMRDVADVTGFATAGESSQLALGEDVIVSSDEDIL